ncbi:tyrosine-type recombinase/integrase [Leuconostoc pseudomesenteroides]|uniref:tyrosine-type recombinase/integrase n=1 Tax=Leuconostoc pseudomesenteroides TaxID=33968 RepID=UPI0032DFA499
MASFEKRGKKWRAVVSYTDAHGIRQKTSKTFELKKSATAWASETETKVNGGLDINAGNITFTDYYKKWVETYKMSTVREATFSKYTTYINIFDDLFKNAQLNKLTINFLQSKINLFGKTHSRAYTKGLIATIKRSLKDAQIDGLIERDIFSRLILTGKQPKKEINYLSAEEFKTLQHWLYSHESEIVNDQLILSYLIAIETGMRFGEIMALSFSDIDYERDTINVDKSYSQHLKAITDPKNTSSIRTVTITNNLSNVIKNYEKKVTRNNIFVLPVYGGIVGRKLSRITKHLNIQNIKFHGLRHSHVSFLLHNDVDIAYISKRVGHSNVTTTLSVYAHILKEKEKTQDNIVKALMEK